MVFLNKDYWALIIGGSSGFGLAAAKKLARHGMNLCIVHRDRRGAMTEIVSSFDEIRKTGVEVATFNLDGLSPEGRGQVITAMSEKLNRGGRVRLLLHSVAFGNLKLLVPDASEKPGETDRAGLSAALNVPESGLQEAAEALFQNGADSLHVLSSPPVYNEKQLLDAGDFARTVHAMGTNLTEWVRDLFESRLFAADARVLSLTSEGNRIAWRGYAAISAAKAALEAVTRAIAVEYAPYGIRANVIQAGVADTPAMRAIPGSRHIKARARLRNPMGRLTRPGDIADVIYLLCLDEAAWINGALLRADGGETIA